jgi:hypothetical protein
MANSLRSADSDRSRLRTLSRIVSSASLLTSLNPRKSTNAVNCSSYAGAVRCYSGTCLVTGPMPEFESTSSVALPKTIFRRRQSHAFRQ